MLFRRMFKDLLESLRPLTRDEIDQTELLARNFGAIMRREENILRAVKIFAAWDGFNRGFEGSAKGPSKKDIQGFMQKRGKADLSFFHDRLTEAFGLGGSKLVVKDGFSFRAGTAALENGIKIHCLTPMFLHPKIGGVSLRSLLVAVSMMSHEAAHSWQFQQIDSKENAAVSPATRQTLEKSGRHYISGEKLLWAFITYAAAYVVAPIARIYNIPFAGIISDILTYPLWGGLAVLGGIGVMWKFRHGNKMLRSLVASYLLPFQIYISNFHERHARIAQRSFAEKHSSPFRQLMRNCGFGINGKQGEKPARHLRRLPIKGETGNDKIPVKLRMQKLVYVGIGNIALMNPLLARDRPRSR